MIEAVSDASLFLCDMIILGAGTVGSKVLGRHKGTFLTVGRRRGRKERYNLMGTLGRLHLNISQ